MSRWWQFAQLSADYKGLNALDHIPQAGNVFIGGLRALDQQSFLEEAGITHILSVLDFDYCNKRKEFAKYQRLYIEADDVWDENLLQHFERSNAFISAAVNDGGTILVHCAMGISRSATLTCAYLMRSQHLKVDEALQAIRQGRSRCDPNAGFMIQLKVYERMLAARSQADANAIYEDWKRNRHDASKL